MPEHPTHTEPFAIYLRQIERLLADVPPGQRAAIRQELIAHLEDAATEAGGSSGDPDLQQAVIARLGPAHELAAALGGVHGGAYRILHRLAFVAGMLGGLITIPAAVLLGAGLAAPVALVGLLMVAAVAGCGALGLAGTMLSWKHQRAGPLLVLASALTLLAGGVELVYRGSLSSFTLVTGALLLLGGELLLVNAIIHQISRTPTRPQSRYLALVVLLLVSFVSPFSYLPNPLGIVYLIGGSYTYDPGSLFVNRFGAIGPDPVEAIDRKLAQLLGKTGLDPLDPHTPLAGYDIGRVTLQHRFSGAATALVTMRYADGSTRDYTIPVAQRDGCAGSQDGWCYSGLDRVLAPHLPLPGLPAVTDDAPVQIGRVQQLPVSREAHQLAAANWSPGEGMRYPTGNTITRLLWSPDGRRFLVQAAEPGSSDGGSLWLVVPASASEGGSLKQIAKQVEAYQWSPDGTAVVYLQLKAFSDPNTQRYTIMIADLRTGGERELGTTDLGQIAMVGEAVYFVENQLLWRRTLDGRFPERLAMLPDAGGPSTLHGPPPMLGGLAVAPDGRRVAYRCGTALCMTDISGGHPVRVPLGYTSAAPTAAPSDPLITPGPLPPLAVQPTPVSIPTAPPVEAVEQAPLPVDLASFGLAWSPDGMQLAVTTGADVYGQGDDRSPDLWIIDRDGLNFRQIIVGPNGTSDSPQWTPDGRLIFMNTFPAGGRRIVIADVEQERIWDLSRPRWDTFAQLSSDGKRLLLWNGRGGFWQAALER